MSRAILLLVMVVSLWPAGGIAVGAVTGAFSDSTSSVDNSSSPDDSSIDDSVEDEYTPPAPTPPPPVTLQGDNGKTYRCSYGDSLMLAPKKEELERRESKLRVMGRNLRGMEREIDRIDEQYPGNRAPAAIANRFNALLSDHNALVVRSRALVDQFNELVDRYNHSLEEECTPVP